MSNMSIRLKIFVEFLNIMVYSVK